MRPSVLSSSLCWAPSTVIYSQAFLTEKGSTACGGGAWFWGMWQPSQRTRPTEDSGSINQELTTSHQALQAFYKIKDLLQKNVWDGNFLICPVHISFSPLCWQSQSSNLGWYQSIFYIQLGAQVRYFEHQILPILRQINPMRSTFKRSPLCLCLLI